MKAIGIVAAMSAMLTAGNALAQAGYPDKPLRILVGFVPGGPADTVARVIGDKFTEAWGKPVVIENRDRLWRQHGDRARRQDCARRLHTPARHLRAVRHPSEPLPEAAVRPGKGFRTDHAALPHR